MTSTNLSYTVRPSNERVTLGQVSGEIKPDRLDILVLTFFPILKDRNLAVPYRIDIGNLDGKNPRTGVFNGTGVNQVHEVPIGDLATVKVNFYCNSQEAGSLEVARP